MHQQDSVLPLKMLLFNFHAANTIIVSFLPLFLQYKGLEGTEIGWVLAIGPFAAIFSQPLWGYMSDKYQTVKWALFTSLMGLIIVSTIFFQMDSLLMFLVVGAIFFFFSSPVGALGDSLAQRRAHDLNISFGGIRMWGSAGFAISSLLAGALFSVIGIQYVLIPYLFFGIVALIISLQLKDVKSSSKVKIKLSDIKPLLNNRALLIFLALLMFITITHRLNDSYMSIYLERLGGGEGLIGMSWFIAVTSETLVFAFAGKWFRKFHPLIFIIVAGFLYSLRWFIYSLVADPAWIVGFQVLHGVTFGVLYLAAFDYVTRLIPKQLQSTGHMMFTAVFFGVSGIIGSLLGGALIDTLGGSKLYFIIGCSALVGTICFTLYHILPYGKEIRPVAAKQH
ncbi:MFS transporter [Radiobacillus sp. PE A8.2]|uniref:MFS transporter n=1 Tax=Radiobacillus sp. PE A8.2 TaxID=3380349 RepID=UPI00388EA538